MRYKFAINILVKVQYFFNIKISFNCKLNIHLYLDKKKVSRLKTYMSVKLIYVIALDIDFLFNFFFLIIN